MKKQKDKVFVLEFTEQELKNPNIKRTMVSLMTLKTNLTRTNPFYEVSEAEVEAISSMSLFTPIKKYGRKGKYPNEIGKYRGKPVCLKK